MKYILISILTFISINTNATQYYVSASGSDANNGTSTLTPFKTISKVNSVAKVAGDIFSFKGGDTFVGEIINNGTGTSGNPIIYNSYGTGQAIITSFVTVSSWNNLGSNIWESSSAVSSANILYMVLINGANTPQGRTPNTGWYTYQSYTGNTSITSSNLNSATINWSGATVVMRSLKFTLERNPITSQSGSTLFYSNGFNHGTIGYGFFIQNDPRTLDVQNEWYYNTTSKKIRIYSTTQPTGVQVPSLDELVFNNGHNYVTFDNLTFDGANTNIYEQRNSQHVTIQNCNLLHAGKNAVLIDRSTSANDIMAVKNNTIRVCNDHALNYNLYSSQDSIMNNTIDSIGMILGGFENGQDASSAIQLHCNTGQWSVAMYNAITNVGHMGIYMTQTDHLNASYNYISNYGMSEYDGGGIYSFNKDTTIVSSRIIDHNIILNSNQVSSGIGGDTRLSLWGIYLDANSNKTTVTNNTLYNGSTGGVHLYEATSNINLSNNTIYNNGNAIDIVNDANVSYISNLTQKNNILFAKTASQLCFSFRNDLNVWTQFGTSDSNYFCRPISEGLTINTQVVYTQTLRNLAMWQTLSGQDDHSHISPATISNINQLFFAYNPNNYDSTVIIPPGNWINVAGTPYNTGTVTLTPYTSIVLISTGSNIPPIANAGTNKNITLPTSTITQVGGGTDADGSISAYLWTQFSGPSTATIVSPTSATTVINSLSVAGTYVFQLKVTDNGGATGVDTMSVVVNSSPPPNQPPVVNAGGNKIITLPTNTVTQTGSATDPDGTVVGYQWAQSVGNPIQATIVSPTSATTVINNLSVGGVYAFTLTATDNLGATGSQTATITVNAPVAVPPTANAGVDQTITWPANSVTLSGTATAGTGTIVSYNWTKISGATFAIANSNSATTTVTGLDVGVYLFQLTVTDNSGLQGKDTMQVTVNKGTASLSYTVTSKVYNSFPQSIDILTSPAGLATATTYNGVSQMPTNVNSYNTVSNITDLAHWNSTAITGVFTITAEAGTFTVSNTTFQYDSLLHTVSVSTSNPAITYTISGAPQRYKGTYTVTVHNTNPNFNVPDAVVTLTITAGTAPPLSWTPANMTYPAAIGASQTNAGDSKLGTYSYTPTTGFIPSATNSLQLKVDFTPADTNLAPIIGTTRTITVSKGTDVMTASDTNQYYDGTPKAVTITTSHGGTVVVTYDGSTTTPPTAIGDHPFSAVYSDPNWQATTITGTLHILSNAANIYITNYSNLAYNGSQQTPTVTCLYPYAITYNGSSTAPTNVGSYITIAHITDGIHVGADTVTMTIIKATPTGTWAAISPVTYIYTVQSGILNASTSTAGSWAYNVAVGDTLIPGTYNLVGTFTPTDAANYNSLVLNNSIVVNKGIATISITNTSKQYNGTVQYATVTTNPANLDSLVVTYTGAHTDAGSYPISAQLFSNLYTATTATSTLTISQGSYQLTYATPAPVQQGTALTSLQENATSTIAGVFTYNYPIGYIVQNNITLTATFHPTDSVNYPVQTISVLLSVYGNPIHNHFIKHGGKTVPLNLQ